MCDYTYCVCDSCKEKQEVSVEFDAVHPYSKRSFVIEYCKHLNLILTDDIKYAVNELECRFPQKVRNEELYG